MTNDELVQWRLDLGWTAKLASKELDISYSMYRLYEKGVRDGKPVEIPRTVELSCYALGRMPALRRFANMV